FTHRDEFYYLRFEKLLEFWQRMEQGGRKSFRYEELEEDFFFQGKSGVLVPYLEGIQKDMDVRD
ncbi:MAG: Holliday junction resolvase RecU, partial [Lachnospiraceae bacterium]|nr:Holliday junction resolvase RecU [Lachnospiraceae bacterium]